MRKIKITMRLPHIALGKKIMERYAWGRESLVRLGSWLFPPRPENQAPEESRFLQGVLQVVLWVAFGAFLLASLPHVAYFFASFEPEDSSGNVSDYWWIISFIIAISIDVTSFLLSLSIANKMRRATRGLSFVPRLGVGLGVALTHWPFIVALVGFSWLVNFEHATQFHSSMLDVAEQVQVNLIVWSGSLHDLNPVIASAFPVLAVAYTGMADDGGANRKKTNGASANSANTQVMQRTDANGNGTSQGEQVSLQDMFTLIKEMHEQQSRSLEQLTRAITNTVQALPANANVEQIEAPKKRTQTAKANGEAANGNSAGSEDIKEQVKRLVLDDPTISARAIARTLGIAPSTAHKWKERVVAELKAEKLLARTVESEQP